MAFLKIYASALSLSFLLFSSFVFLGDEQKNPAANPTSLELPLLKKNETITNHTGFALCYQEKYEQASWVAYELTSEETKSVAPRTNRFLPDPKIKTGSATQADYSRSGYDRGHLAPAADMGWSALTMSESFYFSNMSPQIHSFNAGIWKKAEEQVRSWARIYGSVYIATGPLLNEGLPTIGPNKVAVPEFYYKVVLRCAPNDTSGIGLLMPHQASSLPLSSFFVSIDSIEKRSGIDFFHNLPDLAERQIEETCVPAEWPMVQSDANQPIEKNRATKPGNSVQCRGITKSGVRCKRKTTNANGRCYLHQ